MHNLKLVMIEFASTKVTFASSHISRSDSTVFAPVKLDRGKRQRNYIQSIHQWLFLCWTGSITEIDWVKAMQSVAAQNGGTRLWLFCNKAIFTPFPHIPWQKSPSYLKHNTSNYGGETKGVRLWVPKSKIWALKKALKKVLFWVSVKKSAQKSAQKSTQIKKY